MHPVVERVEQSRAMLHRCRGVLLRLSCSSSALALGAHDSEGREMANASGNFRPCRVCEEHNDIDINNIIIIDIYMDSPTGCDNRSNSGTFYAYNHDLVFS